MPLVGQRSHTSKLEDESALYTVRTLGFRGEALHSLAALSTNLTITSKCHREESNPLGVRLTIGGHLRPGVTNDGQLLEDVPCNVGTIVKVEGLLSTLPVRREEWQRNARRHFSRALYFVQSYVLAAKGVKLRCLHGRQVLFSSSGSGQMARAYVEAFGGMADLKPSTAIPASISAPSGPGLGSFSLSLTSIDMECTLYYAPARRKTADRQFMFINGRPTELAPLFKRLNEATRTAGWDGYALIIVEAHLGGLLDVNLTPDKRQVMLPYEGELIGALVERFSAELSQAALISQVSTPGSDNPRLLPSQTTFSTNAKEEGKATTANTAFSPLQSSETASSTRVEQPTLQKSRTVSPLSATIDALPDTQSMISMPLGCDEGKDIGSHTVLTIEKSDFGRMEIIGQYNCGFILTRLSVPGTSAYHVYIIDQHASDERFRLETLERSLRHTTQSLIQPMSLISLGLDDLMLIDVNRDLLQECGFILTRDSNKVLQITGFPRVMGVQLGFPGNTSPHGVIIPRPYISRRLCGGTGTCPSRGVSRVALPGASQDCVGIQGLSIGHNDW